MKDKAAYLALGLLSSQPSRAPHLTLVKLTLTMRLVQMISEGGDRNRRGHSE